MECMTPLTGLMRLKSGLRDFVTLTSSNSHLASLTTDISIQESCADQNAVEVINGAWKEMLILVEQKTSTL